MIDVCIFPAPLKLANITTVYKKGSFYRSGKLRLEKV